MPYRDHLFSLRLGHALREACMEEPYTSYRFTRDVLAGIAVGIITIPLAMALAIASGVAPQYGLYSAIVGGFIIALTGGSRFSLSGPTAAFVVILYPIAQQHGLAGVLLASSLSGLLLIGMALFRLGRLIEYVPQPVSLGFTSGIAVVIAILQIEDLFGLRATSLPDHYVEKAAALARSLTSVDPSSLGIATVSLIVMLLWPRLKSVVPAHLVAVSLATLAALVLNQAGFDVDTIGSRFSYVLADGSTGRGIPPLPPSFEWPWRQAGPGGEPLAFSWNLARDLIPAAFAIAMLGAMESLMCAVVLDGNTGRHHSANSELLGQGIGNAVTPFFGGIAAAAAIARSSANYKAGAESPVAAMIHSLVVLLGLLALAPLLAWLPMPAVAALMVMAAWKMSDARRSVKLLRSAPKSDLWIFLTCFSLTVLFDIVIAVTAGILLAAVLFMKDVAAMTRVTDISSSRRLAGREIPAGWAIYKISGPLFFAAADRIFSELAALAKNRKGLVLYMDGVSILDTGGLAALTKLIRDCGQQDRLIFIADLQYQPLKTLARAGVQPIPGVSSYFPTLEAALEALETRASTSTPTVENADRESGA